MFSLEYIACRTSNKATLKDKVRFHTCFQAQAPNIMRNSGH